MSRFNSIIHIAVLIAFVIVVGCSQQTARSPESDALLRAARGGHADTVRSLLTSKNMDVNTRDEQGNTPLIEAARNGHDEVVQALLAAKADASVKNKDGKTALMLASEGGHDQVVRVLKQAGAME
ncbi:MAG: ankyrin repeat domain-containing protein [Pyrinomonadaceae bacterium]|nr:ankyrin repeat domain-containing protein [Pyrinomonadaceae bacterium]